MYKRRRLKLKELLKRLQLRLGLWVT